MPANATLSLIDASRNRSVVASLCYGQMDSTVRVPALIFLHGGGLQAADYGWLCQTAQMNSVVILALVRSAAKDSATSLEPMVGDAVLLWRKMHACNASDAASIFYNRLVGIALGGHSMGGAAATLAAATIAREAAHVPSALIAFAPGFWGETQQSQRNASAPLVFMPALLLVGDQDCANEAHTQQLPLFRSLGSAARALVVLRGANHCQWASALDPQRCNFDGCGDLTAAEQQGLGWAVALRFLSAALPSSAAGWPAFTRYLESVGKSRWQYLIAATAGENVSTRCPCPPPAPHPPQPPPTPTSPTPPFTPPAPLRARGPIPVAAAAAS